MALFRCQAPECSIDPNGKLIFDFEIALGQPIVCPKCKRDRAKPENRYMIIPIVTVHFHIPDPEGPDLGHGQRFSVACDRKGLKGRRGTAVLWDVNCKACRETEAWKALALENSENVLAHEDFALEIDVQKGTLTKTG